MSLLWILFLIPSEAVADDLMGAQGACSSNEKWQVSSIVTPRWRELFEDSVDGTFSPQRSFAEALAYSDQAVAIESAVFANYWVSHAFYRAGLIHIAHRGFVDIVKAAPTPSTRGIQQAALTCLNQILIQYPTLGLPKTVVAQLFEYPHSPQIQDAAFLQFTRSRAPALLELLSGEHRAIALGIRAASTAQHKATIRYFQPVHKIRRTFLKRYQGLVHVLSGRAQYRLGRYRKAIQHFTQVSPQSNFFAHSLLQKSWSYLRLKDYRAAIGTTLSLQKGGLANTFTTEAPMIMAMAFNELCQYSRAIKAIELFRREYGDAFRWLKQKSGGTVYPRAIAFLHGSGKVPERIASEWVRSPSFLSHQSELNLYFDERDRNRRHMIAWQREKERMAFKLKKFAQDLRKRFHKAKKHLRPGDQLPKKIRDDFVRMQMMQEHYSRFKQARPHWKQIVRQQDKTVSPGKRRLITSINRDLRPYARRMFHELKRVAEVNKFIEIETLQASTEDLIWKENNRDYENVLAKQRNAAANELAALTWNWGMRTVAADQEAEVWEDEMGSFKASLVNHCSDRDQYAAIKRQQTIDRLKKRYAHQPGDK